MALFYRLVSWWVSVSPAIIQRCPRLVRSAGSAFKVSSLGNLLKRLLHSEVFRKSLGLTTLLYLSPVIGLLSEIIFIRVFGVGNVMDIFRANMTFMLMGQGIIASQLLKYAIIPQLAIFREAKQDREGLIFSIYFIVLIVTIISPVIILGLGWPEILMGYLTPGFSADLIHDATGFVRLASAGFLILTLVGGMSAIGNFYGIFWGQPLGQTLFNLAIALGILIFGTSAVTRADQLYQLEIYVGIGLLVSLAIMLVLCVQVWRSTEKAAVSFSLWQILQMSFILILPQLFTLVGEICKPLIVNRALSHMDEGAISIYNFSFRLLMLGHLPALALATVLFPHTSKVKARGNIEDLRRQTWQGSMLSFLLAALMTIILYITAPWWMDILAAAAQMKFDTHERLIHAYRILVILTPGGAVALFYINTLFACHMRKAIIAYSLITTVVLAALLEWFRHSGINGVCAAYVISTYAGALLLAGILFVYLRQGPTAPDSDKTVSTPPPNN